MNKIIEIPISELKDYENNAKEHTEKQIENLKKSLTKFGWMCPCIVDKNNVLVVGHGRVEAARRLGIEKAECIMRDDLSEEMIDEYRVIDNLLSEGGYDEAKLKYEINRLDIDYDFSEINTEIEGINIPEAEEEIEIIEDEVPEVQEKAITKLGDIYQLGQHRLICGDSTDPAVIDRLMDGVKADMVFTDPPYGMNLDTDYSKLPQNKEFEKEKGIKGGKTYDKVIGDNEDFKDELITTIFNNFDYCKEIFVWGGDYYPELLKDYKNGNFIVWDKKSNEGMENHNFDKTLSSNFELCWSKNRHKRDIVRCLWVSAFGTEQEFDHKRVHPTQKPTKLSRWFIDKYSKENENIVDLFGGSGSTLIACEQLNRKCYMAELSPEYVDVIIARWENLTGEKAVKL